MEWHYRFEETRTTVTDDGEFVVVLHSLRTMSSVDELLPTPGAWHGRIFRAASGAVLMTTQGDDVEAVQLECTQWLRALHTARERDPQTDMLTQPAKRPRKRAEKATETRTR